MKKPSIFGCLPGVLNSPRTIPSIADLPPPPPPQEILPPEESETLYIADPITLQGGTTLLKAKVSSIDIFGVQYSDIVPGKYEGGLKVSDSAVDLVDTLRHEIQDGQLSFRGKRVLEIGCGQGLPGIFACLKGASVVHFQDFNADVLKHVTIPNVNANLEYARARVSRNNGSLTPSRSTILAPEVHYFAGDWSDVHLVLSQVGPDQGGRIENESSEFNFSFAERDCSRPSTPTTPPIDVDSMHDRSSDVPSHRRIRSRKRSLGRRACERSTDDNAYDGGYDIILMSDTVYSSSSLPKLYSLAQKCLRPFYGVMYVAGKKHYLGNGGGIRQFKHMIEDDGIFGAHLVAEFGDCQSNIIEVWKFFFR